MVEVARRSTFTQSQEDYLKALYHLHGDTRPVPTRELAQRLGISPPSPAGDVPRPGARLQLGRGPRRGRTARARHLGTHGAAHLRAARPPAARPARPSCASSTAAGSCPAPRSRWWAQASTKDRSTSASEAAG